MEHKEKVLRIALAIVASVFAGRILLLVAQPMSKILCHPESAALLVYLETGRVIKPVIKPVIQEATEATEGPEYTQPKAEGILFQEGDAELVQVSNFSHYAVDLPGLLTRELQWNLKGQTPRVLILHSHATESYTQTAQFSYEPSAAYRTLDVQCNMVRIGAALQEALEAKGIRVIHDTTLHDHPSYNDAYINSRETAQDWLAQYPDICLIIDLHRDAADTVQGEQLDTQAVVEGAPSAQLMLVVGSDAGGRHHPDWEENMALAAKLHAQLEKRYPGICRPISFRTERFNQDLSAGALLIEVGAAGDTLEEALVAVTALAEGIADLAAGVIIADSTS